MKTIIPKRLHKGALVGIISPSGPVGDRKQQFQKGVQKLESWGLKVKYFESVFDQHYYSAGTRIQRAKEFNEMWRDPKVKMVMMAQGGFTANHILDAIDYEMIKKNPKMFVGFSDGTTLVNAIYARTGLMTYLGPDLMWTFGKPMSKAIEENIKKTFFDGQVGEIKPNLNWKHKDKSKKRPGWKCIRKGNASGVAVGGHLAVVCGNILAGYFPNTKGKILLLEGTDEVAELDWYLYALKLHGVFNGLKGMVLGWFDESAMKAKEENRNVSEMVLEVTADYKFPILEINELGHNVEDYVYPVGGQITIDAAKKYLSVDGKTAK